MMTAVEPVTDGQFERSFIDHPLYDINTSNFALEIEKVVKETKCNYIEAIIQLCDKYEIEYSAVVKILTPTMIDKIEMDGEALHMFRRNK